MLCKMINSEERTMSNGNVFYVCKFSYNQGNANAETFITLPNGMQVLNPEVAALRQINLTKCLFPTEDANAQRYAMALHAFSAVCENNKQTTNINGKMYSYEQFNIALPLIYKTKPVAELTGGVEYVEYYDANNEAKKLYNFSVVGYSKIQVVKNVDNSYDVKDLDEWDEAANGGNLDDYMKRQFDTNIANGTYTLPSITDEKAIAGNENLTF